MCRLSAHKVIVGVLAIALGRLLYGGDATSLNLVQPQGINVSGEGTVTGQPDVAVLRLGVSTRAASVVDAQAQAQRAMEQLLKAVKDRGIAERDIQTRQFNISPEYTQRPGPDQPTRIVGYRVTNTVSVKVRRIESTSEIIDAATKAAGDALQIQGISFMIDDPAKLRQQAREKAMLDAKSRAELLARLGGVTLGKPIYVNEGGAVPLPIVSMERETYAAAAQTPISPGELEVTVRVQVTYAILP